MNDARLVVLNAKDAQDRGAKIETRSKVVYACREKDYWNITTEDVRTGDRKQHKARLIVNAAGPWVDKVLDETMSSNKSKIPLRCCLLNVKWDFIFI